LPTVLGFWGDLQGPWHSLNVWEVWPKTHHFYFLGRFMSYCPQFWVSREILKADDT
jgi:hypothetical protein